MKRYIFLVLIFTGIIHSSVSQVRTNVGALHSIANDKTIQSGNNRKAVVEYARKHNVPIRVITDSSAVEMILIDEYGLPQYYITHNANAAKTISTNKVYSGGGAGLSLSGAGVTVRQWDAGDVLSTHQEFGTRVTNLNALGTVDHSTLIAGTIMASGAVAAAKGMAFSASLRAFDWLNDDAEMASEAASGALVSNHSYGTRRGWDNNVWYGNPAISTQEDFLFGFYNYWAADWDDIAYNAPNYLIVISAGNDRNDTGDWSYPDDGAPDGYDCIGPKAVAKNVLTVGAVYDIITGWTHPTDVVETTFSSWGPADDGRIKPDIVANGVSLYSTHNAFNFAYANYSGTSPAAPTVTGSAALLIEHYGNVNPGRIMTAATLKALIIHTADEAGTSSGPDYEFGWGLMNTASAAAKITEDQSTDVMLEHYLSNGGSYTREITTNGTNPLFVTVVWTDPAGTPAAASLDPTDAMLVNDLDLKITQGGTTYSPYSLNPASPSNAATNTGENNVDNVEQVYIASPANSTTYTITVDHDGTLSSGGQAFSMIISGDIVNAIAPVADFFADNTTPAINTDVQFTDASANIPTSWSWTFSPTTVTYKGGTSASSQNPIVEFDAAGRYTVTLQATNAHGSDSEIKTDYIATSASVNWTGATSTDWNTASNWSNGFIPASGDDITIPGGLTNYPSVDESNAVCYDLSINNGGQVIMSTGGILTIGNDLSILDGGLFRVNDGSVTISNELVVGAGVSGTFDLDGGSVTVTKNFNSAQGCTVDISGGSLDIGANWRKSNTSIFSQGTISLSGGTINVSQDAIFSVNDVIGSMTGDFQMTIGDDFHNNDIRWGTVTGGTITMTASKDGSCTIGSTNADYDAVAYNLIINGLGVFTLGADVDLEGSLFLTVGTFDVSANNFGINLSGDWTNNGGGFTAQNGTVTFDGTSAQTIGGSSSTTFYDGVIANSVGVSVGVNTTIGNNLTVNTGQVFNVNAGYGLSVNGNLSNGGTTTIKSTSPTSNGSMIVGGTSTGEITYERYVSGVGQWHLVSAPVVGQGTWAYATAPGNSIALKSSRRAITDYNEGSDNWNSYPSSDPLTSFTTGKGYSTLRTIDGLVSFTGTVQTNDVTGISITRGGQGWNLLGNPYPSAINATTTAHATNTLLNPSNVGNLDASYAALYLWDPAAGGSYKTINNSGATNPSGSLGQDYISPGQGFFVRARDNSSRTFGITEAMQSHQGSVAFKSTSNTWPTIKLIAKSADHQSSTVVAFHADMTSGLDVSYDAGMFKSNPDFSLYTRLVEDNGVDFAIQSLPDSDIQDMIIPIGLDAPAGTVVSFQAELFNLPEDWEWFLEDRDAGVITLLVPSEVLYTVTLNDKNRGVGSFFLHPGANSMGVEEFETLNDPFRIFIKPQDEYIRIISFEVLPTQAQVFDLSGRMIVSIDLESGIENFLFLRGQNPGIYLLRIQNAERMISKKIFWYK